MLAAIRDNHIVCLLSDRDIAGDGVEVDFFGERTTLPPGPVTLALRTGAPLLPAAVYFRGDGHHAVVRPPMDLTRQGRFRDDVARLTQDLADELEALIRLAPGSPDGCVELQSSEDSSGVTSGMPRSRAVARMMRSNGSGMASHGRLPGPACDGDRKREHVDIDVGCADGVIELSELLGGEGAAGVCASRTRYRRVSRPR